MVNRCVGIMMGIMVEVMASKIVVDRSMSIVMRSRMATMVGVFLKEVMVKWCVGVMMGIMVGVMVDIML